MKRRTCTAIALALAAVALACTGCAAQPTPTAKPLCPVAKIHHFEANGTTWFLVDYDNLDALRLRMIGLRDGTCDAGEFFGVDADADDGMQRP